jgi:hypothetical protein
MALYYNCETGIRAWLGSYQAVLLADTDTPVAVPTGANYAIFANDYPIWVDDSTITLPVANRFNVTTALKNPTQCCIRGSSILHIRARTSGDVHITFFS